MVSVLRPGDRIHNIPGIGVQTSRRAVSSGNGLLNSLVAYWPGNEASGNLLDAHTNALHLTDGNTVTNAAGIVYPTARQYTAANQEYHTRPGDDALLSVGDVDFTVSAWVRADTVPGVGTVFGIAGKFPPSTVYEYWIYIYNNAGVIRFQFGASSDGTGGTISYAKADNLGTPAINTWYLLIAWHDAVSDTINIQANNGLVNSTSHAGGVKDGGNLFRIGALLATANHWNGRIGPVAMWKSAPGGGGCLSAAQRTALWNAGAGLPYASFTV